MQIVKLLDAFPVGLDFIMVFEYMPTGLWEVIKDTGIVLTPAQIKTYAKMILEGTAYIHEKNIIHRVMNLNICNLSCTFSEYKGYYTLTIFKYILKDDCKYGLFEITVK